MLLLEILRSTKWFHFSANSDLLRIPRWTSVNCSWHRKRRARKKGERGCGPGKRRERGRMTMRVSVRSWQESALGYRSNQFYNHTREMIKVIIFITTPPLPLTIKHLRHGMQVNAYPPSVCTTQRSYQRRIFPLERGKEMTWGWGISLPWTPWMHCKNMPEAGVTPSHSLTPHAPLSFFLSHIIWHLPRWMFKSSKVQDYVACGRCVSR